VNFSSFYFHIFNRKGKKNFREVWERRVEIKKLLRCSSYFWSRFFYFVKGKWSTIYSWYTLNLMQDEMKRWKKIENNFRLMLLLLPLFFEGVEYASAHILMSTVSKRNMRVKERVTRVESEIFLIYLYVHYDQHK
jgi:hypothetical protein